MFKSKREQGEVKNALKAELADLRNNFADPDEIEEVEQRMTDQAYDAREEMATHCASFCREMFLTTMCREAAHRRRFHLG